VEGSPLYRLRQAAGGKGLLAAAFELVEGKNLGTSYACCILLCPVFCLNFCIDWIILCCWSHAERHSSYAEVLNGTELQNFLMSHLVVIVSGQVEKTQSGNWLGPA